VVLDFVLHMCSRWWALSNGRVSSNNSRLEVIVLCITMSGLKGVAIKSGGIVDGGDSQARNLGMSA